MTARPFSLTRSESRVVALVALGLSDDAIALHLGIKPNSARYHVDNALQKLGVNNRTRMLHMFWSNQIPELSKFRLLIPALDEAIGQVEAQQQEAA